VSSKLRALIVGCLAFGAILIAVVSGWEPVQALGAPTRATAKDETAGFRVFFTGDTRGYIRPCGCSTGQFGGFARRATHLAAARRPGDLLIDLGNLVEGKRPHERLKLSYVLQGLKLLKYDVLVPGTGELALGEDFERAVKQARLDVICANLVNASTGKPVFEPWAIRAAPGGRKVAVVGLTSPDQPLPARYRVTSPSEALRSALESLRGKADVLVVAAYLEGKPALDLAREFPSVDVVLSARVPRGSDALLRRGGAPVMLGGERGQYVGRVEFDKTNRAFRGARDWLGEVVADTAELAALVRHYDEDVKRFGAAFARNTATELRAASWAGSERCAECHQGEFEAWKRSKHSHAMAVLRAKGQQANPNCMKCHYSDVADKESDVAGVGCESCHGGGAPHVVAVTRNLPRVSLRTFRKDPRALCSSCHDEANSPRFEYEDYWKRIVHSGREEE